MSAITTNMKHLTELILLTNLLLITKSTSDFEFEEDFIHSFLIKSEKLTKSERLKSAETNWMKRSSYKVNFRVNFASWGYQEICRTIKQKQFVSARPGGCI